MSVLSVLETSEKYIRQRWNEYISAGAITTLKEAKWNAPQIIPFTQDVKILHAHLEKKHHEFISKLRSCPSSADSYAALAKVTLSQVILFNRRREGEVSRMLFQLLKAGILLSCMKTSPSVFSEFERKLCLHFTRVEIRGKRGEKGSCALQAFHGFCHGAAHRNTRGLWRSS